MTLILKKNCAQMMEHITAKMYTVALKFETEECMIKWAKDFVYNIQFEQWGNV